MATAGSGKGLTARTAGERGCDGGPSLTPDGAATLLGTADFNAWTAAACRQQRAFGSSQTAPSPTRTTPSQALPHVQSQALATIASWSPHRPHLSVQPALAQARTPSTVRVRGVIVARRRQFADRQGSQRRSRSPWCARPTCASSRCCRSTQAAIKPNSFVGAGSLPQPDGTQRAARGRWCSPEAMRGTGEGFRPGTTCPTAR